MRREPEDLVKGAIAGVAAGLVASLVMNQFQALWAKAQQEFSEDDAEEEARENGGGKEEPATVKAADRVSEVVAGGPVPEERRELAGEAVHYATGAGAGLLYGTMAEIAPLTTFGFGAGYGALVAVGLDETLVPALGLSKGPRETSPAEHAYGMASHIVFGLTLEGVRRLIRALI